MFKALHSEIDELSVLSSMLASRDVADRALERLQVTDFYGNSSRLIFKTMSEMIARGEKLDAPGLVAALKKNGEIDFVGGAEKIVDLMEGSTEAQNPEVHIENLRDYSTFRNFTEKFTDILNDARTRSIDADTLLEDAEKTLYEISERRTDGEQIDINKALLDYYDKLKHRSETGEISDGYKTGLPSLDRVTAGLQKGNLIILAARPSVGKTSLALDFCRAGILRGEHVAFFALEQTVEEIFSRLVSVLAKIPTFKLSHSRLSEEDLGQVLEAMNKISDNVFNIDCSMTGESPIVLKSKCRKMATRLSRQGKKLSLIVVDYLQLMGGETKSFENRQNEVSQISRALKKMAMELKVPVLALSQLNRKPEERSGGEPLLSDLRESGSIEQDADLVMMLWRSDDRTKLAIKKHRNGPPGQFSLFFEKEYSSFKEMTEEVAEEERYA